MLFADLRHGHSMVCYSPIKNRFMLLNPDYGRHANGRVYYRCFVDGNPLNESGGWNLFTTVLEQELIEDQYEFICTL